MNTTRHQRHILIAAFATCAALGHAQNLEITPQRPQQGLSTDMRVDAQGTLSFHLQGQQWHVHSWPANLPRQLDAQQVQSLFANHPAGPVQALRLSQPRETAPWLAAQAARLREAGVCTPSPLKAYKSWIRGSSYIRSTLARACGSRALAVKSCIC